MNFDFNYILLPATLLCGLAWLLQKWRNRLARHALESSADESASAGAEPSAAPAPGKPKQGLIFFLGDLFPILFVVFFIRSFIVEPYQIPSGSMLPTLRVGDFILVSKSAYGVRAPLSNTRLIPWGEPERGDILVFEFPQDKSTRYIKRVVGLPGDRIELNATSLAVNGVQFQLSELDDDSKQRNLGPGLKAFREDNGEHQYSVARDLTQLLLAGGLLRARKDSWEVPPGHYFVLGDNRENSNDSRYWGFVPEENVIGRAFFIWLYLQGWSSWPSFDNFGSIDG